MRKTVDQETLESLRTLINYLEEDGQVCHEQSKGDDLSERINHAVVQIKQWLDQPKTSHDLAASFVNDWFAEHVLCMIAGSDDQNGLLESASGIVAREEAIAQLNLTLSRHGLSPIRYHPAIDTVELCWEPSDAMGHRYFGLAPLGTDLSYERRAVPFDVWQVSVNGIVVYPESEVEDTEETTATGMASHSPQMRGPDGLTE